MLQRQRDRLGAAADAQFREDAADVEFDGRAADDQMLSDLRVVLPFDQQGQHFMFAFGQVETDLLRLCDGVNESLRRFGCDQRESIGKTVRHANRCRKFPRRAKDAKIQFVRIQRGKDCRAGVMGNSIHDVRSVPDICVIRRDAPVEPVFTRSPLICIEIVSKDDTLRGMQERVNEEIRRRERVIRIFPNDEAALRLIGALLAERNEAWQGRLYLDMDEFMEWAAAKQMLNDIGNNVVAMSS